MPAPDQPKAAVESLLTEARTDPDKIVQLMAIAGDRTADAATRRAALYALQELGFTTALLAVMNAQLIAMLRGFIDDPNLELRDIAVEMLAQKKDEVVQQRLLDGLERREPPIVADARALHLLGYDIHAGQFPTVRKFAQQSPDPAARLEAVRLLAADTESADLLLTLFDDRTQPDDVRRASGSALLSVAPDRYAQRAKQAVLDESESESVRLSSLTALTHFANPADLPNDRQFIAGIAKIALNEDKLAAAVRMFKEEHGIA